MKIVSRLCALLLGASTLSAAATTPLVAAHMNVIEEKRNVIVNLDAGSAAELGRGRDLNGLQGRTRDFQGQSVPLYAISDGSISAGRFLRLVQFDGQLAGMLQCQLVQLGNSPDMPGVKLVVLAQQCAIVRLNH
ncbi:hypothetical protein QN362_07840 [Actimicrobium sp. CCC2.4]|uniref:hypothetical protein n=1 Tax=Actimicrobium sp. CCC2.4 TaxID=3048606 RepID=UPI002AC92ECD|nr:hypothetical protein [Actimicrobium sp. CCC2.4]MEB0135240.1 hypothetical protein [Actimicrobium sp. CCC2.4]WPX31034.1 hypothetical protein RHM62_12300 [Actimicrobium sp. CCC2.4]